MFTLYTTPLSANGRKALAVCRHLGLSPDVREVNVYRGEGRAPAFLAVHPLGKIPALVDGDLSLWESNAILQYVAEAYGEDRLWSREPKRRADIARWMFWESAHWQPALVAVPGLAREVARRLGLSGPAAASERVEWESPGFAPLARLLDAHLAGRPFLAGEDLTLADFAVAGMMTYARATSFPFATWPSVAAWFARIEALDAWKATAAGPWRG